MSSGDSPPKDRSEEASCASSQPLYHLADGVILAIGTVDTCLVDLERDYEIRIDFRYVEALERTTLGSTLEGYETYIPRLLSENILSEGSAKPDRVIRQRLALLDSMYMRDYADS
ncbi:MAG: hypothetical protein R3C68_02285 [Myxococcota bacterium]